MFCRKKKNKSGVVSVQIIEKRDGHYRMLKTIGSSSDELQIARFEQAAAVWIKEKQGQLDIDFSGERERAMRFLENVTQISVAGTELLLGRLFDEVGFSKVSDPLFRRLVLARLCFPSSKLRTTDYLSKYEYLTVDVQAVYRYMDKLHKNQKETVQQISYAHTLSVLGGEMHMVFYDVTTLYFEIEEGDELRKTGFSKEGKHQNPQILLGLLVSTDAYPLAYEIFEGSKYEGHTMLPVIEGFKEKSGVGKLVVVADSGLLSAPNIAELTKAGHEFILGARIKNEPMPVRQKILGLGLKNGESAVIEKENGIQLVISFAAGRSKKDRANRERGLQKLEKQIKSGKLTKANINQRGYNKYLKMAGEISVEIDRDRFDDDQKWDDLKGYLTNTGLSKEQVIEQYGHLWKIEKAFRVSKNELKIRPIFHRVQRRIEAHICIAFAAYKLYKELERQLKLKNAPFSPEKAIEIAKTIYSVKVKLENSLDFVSKTLIIRPEQQILADLFAF